MQNFTHSWARAASQPQQPAVPPQAGLPSGVDIAGVRTANRPAPAPQAGLNEQPAAGGLGQYILQQLQERGKKNSGVREILLPMFQKIFPNAGQAQPAAQPAPQFRPEQDRMDRASRLAGIGAGLMD